MARQRRFEERVQVAHEQKKRELEAEQKAISEIQAHRTEDDDEEMIINQVMSSKKTGGNARFQTGFQGCA